MVRSTVGQNIWSPWREMRLCVRIIMAKLYPTQLRGNPVVVFGGVVQFHTMPISDDASMHRMFQIYQHTRYQLQILELYVEFEVVEHRKEMEEEQNILRLLELENNLHSEDEFEANYEFSDDNEDGVT
ncbi:hypothetical protein PIB30_094064 [Stylosanthes scabra]|uniref:Uncharacterized protein n=1 Tax=Stylosanthes scabra TaxID=79078 RepID=A0ABU6YVK8_9FABA|nr:hypothetical protein [Stylosanthes scabra]